MTRILIALFVLGAFVADDRDKGRKGNKRYHEKKFQEAARLYSEGITEMSSSTNAAIRTGLHNNLGSALNRLESFEEASAAFAQAIETSETLDEFTRATYNAGNNAFQAQSPEQALGFYKRALIADPSNEDARYNYEFVRRLLESQKQESDQNQNQQQQQQDENQNQQDNQDQQEQDQEDQEQQDQEQQDQQNQDQQQQDQQGDDQDQQQNPEQQEPDPSQEMTREQAEQILQALQNDEEELMKEVWRMKGKPKAVEKDW